MINKVLITGGDGFIGKHLCQECDRQGVDYCIFGKVSTNVPSSKVYNVDIRDREGISKAIREYQPDSIVHLAAVASVVCENVSELYDINIKGTENLLSAAQKDMKAGSRFVLISTAGVYGNQDVPLLSEDLPFNPANHYSISKMATEILSRQYMNDLDIHIVRPFNVIGVGQSNKFLIPKLIEHFSEKREEIKIGNLQSVRDYISVDFCARVLCELATSESKFPGILNICSGVGHSGKQVIELLEKITAHYPRIVFNGSLARTNEVWNLVGSTELLCKTIKVTAEETLEKILRKMLLLKDLT